MIATRRRSVPALIALLALILMLPGGVAGASLKTFEGTLRLAHGDAFAQEAGRSRSVRDYSLETSTGTLRLAFSGGAEPDGFFNGAKVRVRGSLSGGTVTVGRDPGSSQLVASAPVAVTGTKRVALLLVNFLTKTTQPWTLAQANGILFSNANSVANYFAEESEGLLNVTGDVFGYYTIDFNTAGCNYTDLATKARAAAAAAGVNLSTYTNVQFAFPSLPCGWSGLAYLPGTESWINNALTLYVSGHELSHNFGVHHASSISCTESGVRVALSANAANCTVSEYGDPFSMLGNGGSRHTHNQQLATLGFLSGSALSTVSAAGTYALGAAENSSATVRAIRVARGDGTYLYLELRMPFGLYFDNFGSGDAVVNGVSLRTSRDWSTIIQSRLIDTTPQTSSYLDAALAVNATFSDPVSGVRVKTLSVGGGVASVQISWGPDLSPPTTPTNLAASMTGSTTSRLTWTASSDNVGVSGYQVSRDGTALGTVSGTLFDDSGLVPGTTVNYSVVAVDGAGNASAPATRSLVVPFVDTTAPTAPTDLRVANLTKAKVTLAWLAAFDDVSVAGYRVYRNSVLVATTTALTWMGTRHRNSATYYVVAFDAAGNVSPPSISVSVAAK